MSFSVSNSKHSLSIAHSLLPLARESIQCTESRSDEVALHDQFTHTMAVALVAVLARNARQAEPDSDSVHLRHIIADTMPDESPALWANFSRQSPLAAFWFRALEIALSKLQDDEMFSFVLEDEHVRWCRK